MNFQMSFLCGKSTHNQRIEWFGGLLRREMGQFYIDLFSDLEKDHNDLFCGDMFDKNLIQFCFLEVIQVLFRWYIVYDNNDLHKCSFEFSCKLFLLLQSHI